MSKSQNDSFKSSKPRTSKLALFTFLIALVVIAFFLLVYVVRKDVLPRHIEIKGPFTYLASPVVNFFRRSEAIQSLKLLSVRILLALCVGCLAVVFVPGTLYFMRARKGRVSSSGKGFAVAGVTLVLVAASVFLGYTIGPAITGYIELSTRTKSFDGESSELKQTIIVPTLDTPFQPGKNIIWCSSFQIAWNELKDSVIKGPVVLSGAKPIYERLNNAQQSKNDLPEDSYLSMAGVVAQGIVERIQSGMKKRFSSKPVPQFPNVGPDYIIAYSFLNANVKFKIPFYENNRKLVFVDSQGRKTEVTSFGIRPEDGGTSRKLRDQVKILYMRREPQHFRPSEFAVDLCRFSKPNQIVLARVGLKGTLEQTLLDLQNKLNEFSKQPGGKCPEIGITDVLFVPNFFWRIVHHFREIEGKVLLSRPYSGYELIEAKQMVDFRLDRSGARLKSEARIIFKGLSMRYVFDKPFLIYIRKRGAEYPFFVMWVDNTELLTRP